MLWKRPTAPWKLSCESRGQTRKLATEKATIQIVSSSHGEHVYNCGVAICVIFGMIACCSCLSFNSPPVLIGLTICTRVIWLIIGPIILTSLGKITTAIESNLSIAGEFDVINICADEYAKVDTAALRQI